MDLSNLRLYKTFREMSEMLSSMHDASTSSPDVPEHGFFRRSSDGWMDVLLQCKFLLRDLQDSRTIKSARCTVTSYTCHLAFIQLLADRARHPVDFCICLFFLQIHYSTVYYSTSSSGKYECGIQGVPACMRQRDARCTVNALRRWTAIHRSK
jgi:hypothetical protein